MTSNTIIINKEITMTIVHISYPEEAFGQNALVVKSFLLTNFPSSSFTCIYCVRYKGGYLLLKTIEQPRVSPKGFLQGSML